MSDWFQSSGIPTANSDAEALRGEFVAVKEGLSDLLPSLSGNADKPVFFGASSFEAKTKEEASLALEFPVTERVTKTSDTSRTAGVDGLSADPHLSYSLDSGVAYEVFLSLLIDCVDAVTSGFAFNMNFSGTTTKSNFIYEDVGSGDGEKFTSLKQVDVSGPAEKLISVNGSIITGSSGDLSFLWYSRIFSAEIILKEGSSMVLRKIAG